MIKILYFQEYVLIRLNVKQLLNAKIYSRKIINLFLEGHHQRQDDTSLVIERHIIILLFGCERSSISPNIHKYVS